MKHFFRNFTKDSFGEVEEGKNQINYIFTFSEFSALTQEASQSAAYEISGENPSCMEQSPPSYIMTSSNGHMTSSNGHMASPNGHMASPNGHMTSPNGHMTSSNEQIISTNGHPMSQVAPPLSHMNTGQVNTDQSNVYQNMLSDPHMLNSPQSNLVGQSMMSPGQSMVSPGQGIVSPGQSMVSPGQNMVSPGQNMVSPGQNMVSPGQNMVSPGQNMVSPGQNIVSPGQYHMSPGDQITSPGGVSVTRHEMDNLNLNQPSPDVPENKVSQVSIRQKFTANHVTEH